MKKENGESRSFCVAEGLTSRAAIESTLWPQIPKRKTNKPYNKTKEEAVTATIRLLRGRVTAEGVKFLWDACQLMKIAEKAAACD